MVAVLGRRLPGAWPPSATGRGRGPPETSYCEAMTQDTVGGYGVERSGTEPPGSLLSGTAEEIPDQVGDDEEVTSLHRPGLILLDIGDDSLNVKGDDSLLALL